MTRSIVCTRPSRSALSAGLGLVAVAGMLAIIIAVSAGLDVIDAELRPLIGVAGMAAVALACVVVLLAAAAYMYMRMTGDPAVALGMACLLGIAGFVGAAVVRFAPERIAATVGVSEDTAAMGMIVLLVGIAITFYARQWYPLVTDWCRERAAARTYAQEGA